MTFLPIVRRELRVAARRRGTYWTRCLVALGAIGTGTCFYLGNLDAPAPMRGRFVFLGLMALALLYCLLAGRRFTADCLSEEKRAGTLGLLFLTDLKGYDVVLGKLAATSLSAFYALLALFPVLAVTLMLGGTSRAEFWRGVLVLSDTFFYSLAIGIFVSSLSRDSHRALGANVFLLLLLSAVPAACGLALTVARTSPRPIFALFWTCPVFPLFLCQDFAYMMVRSHFWISLAVIHALTWLLLGLASRFVRHSWQDRAPGPRRHRWREFRYALTYGTAATRKKLRKRLLDVNAFYWLAARVPLKPLGVWLVLAAVGGYWAWAQSQYGPDWKREALNPTNIAAAVMLGVALKTWIGVEAGQRLAEEHKAGTFELLLSTCLTGEDILRGQWLALRRLFLKPTLAVLGVELIFLGWGMRWPSSLPSGTLMIWPAMMILLVADMLAVSWLAMSTALTARTPQLAAAGALTRVLLLPLLAFGAVAGAARVVAALEGKLPPGMGFYLGWWFLLGLATDLAYGLPARHRLRTRLRQLASGSPVPA